MHIRRFHQQIANCVAAKMRCRFSLQLMNLLFRLVFYSYATAICEFIWRASNEKLMLFIINMYSDWRTYRWMRTTFDASLFDFFSLLFLLLFGFSYPFSTLFHFAACWLAAASRVIMHGTSTYQRTFIKCFFSSFSLFVSSNKSSNCFCITMDKWK